MAALTDIDVHNNIKHVQSWNCSQSSQSTAGFKSKDTIFLFNGVNRHGLTGHLHLGIHSCLFLKFLLRSHYINVCACFKDAAMISSVPSPFSALVSQFISCLHHLEEVYSFTSVILSNPM